MARCSVSELLISAYVGKHVALSVEDFAFIVSFPTEGGRNFTQGNRR